MGDKSMNDYSEVTGVVYVLDDDAHVREGLGNLLHTVGLRAMTFVSLREFLASMRPDAPSCLVLDVRLPGLSGLDIQAELINLKIDIPIVFITGYGDIPMTVKAMKAGAIEFLTKPIREQDLLDAVQIALERDRVQRGNARVIADARARFGSLTSRERNVVALVASGKMNKQVAAEIGVSEISVKVHRHNAMKKLGVKSLAELVRMIDMLGINAQSHGKGASADYFQSA
jgi:FixJ family two-component response regulator